MRAAALRLARADLLARPGQTVLTAVAIFAAATALVVTLALRAGLDDPFADAHGRRRAAPTSRVYGELSDADVAALDRACRASPRPTPARARARARRSTARDVEVGLEALPAANAAVDRPHVTDGRRPARRGRGPASSAASRATSGLRVGRPRSRRHGTRSPASPSPPSRRRYPRWDPGIVWAHRRRPAPGRRVGVRLARPRGHRRVRRRRPARAARHAARVHRLARRARHDHRPDAHERARHRRSTRCWRCSRSASPSRP